MFYVNLLDIKNDSYIIIYNMEIIQIVLDKYVLLHVD